MEYSNWPCFLNGSQERKTYDALNELNIQTIKSWYAYLGLVRILFACNLRESFAVLLSGSKMICFLHENICSMKIMYGDTCVCVFLRKKKLAEKTIPYWTCVVFGVELCFNIDFRLVIIDKT